jgi:hypothetical protein
MLPFFQAVLTGLQGLGGGIAKGIGSSLGLDLAKNIPNVATIKSPVSGKLLQVATLPVTSTWEKLGTMLGTQAMGSQAPSLPSAPSLDTSTRVQAPSQRALTGGFQRGKKSQLETLIEQLARR